ncbi:MAG: hypothetical protein L0Y79_00885 [Chlorobi bacterium]|nr:hypothetical protein [Chlorobiota bacterium]MCI0715042.1 hypothetical protein [Chlorobiota bacterium]
MKNLILAVLITLSFIFGFNTLNSQELTPNSAIETSITTDSYIYVRVYEDGAWWIYTYTQDGIYVAKCIDY